MFAISKPMLYMILGIAISLLSASMREYSIFFFSVGITFFLYGLSIINRSEEEDEEAIQELLEANKERRHEMFYDDNNMRYPILYIPSPIVRPEPRDTIARRAPDLAADVLKTESIDNSLVELANSKVATIFAAQGAGTYAASIRKRSFFGGEKTEYIIRPI